MLYVEKGGEIIPKITGVDDAAREPDSKPVEFIKECPVCGTALVRVEGEAAWMCPNKYGCVPQICGRIEHFVGRRMMNIDGIGEEMVVLLYRNGWVRDIADLYSLDDHRSEMLLLPGIGPRTVDRIIEGIEASKKAPFERVVYALSIPYVGETGAKKLARAVRNIDALMSASAEQLTAIDDIGPRIAESIIDFFAAQENRDIINRLKIAGVTMSMPDEEEGEGSDKLSGKTIVISGTFLHHSRDEYKEIIERNGGKNAGSISKKTDFILAGDNMGPSKREKAVSLNIPMLSEDEFLELISE